MHPNTKHVDEYFNLITKAEVTKIFLTWCGKTFVVETKFFFSELRFLYTKCWANQFNLLHASDISDSNVNRFVSIRTIFNIADFEQKSSSILKFFRWWMVSTTASCLEVPFRFPAQRLPIPTEDVFVFFLFPHANSGIAPFLKTDYDSFLLEHSQIIHHSQSTCDLTL
jgi:hypothetical protein